MSRSKKHPISLPEDLGETVRARVRPGELPACVAEALEHRVAMGQLEEIVADFETDNDPLTHEEIEAARAVLQRGHRQPCGASA